MYEKGPALPGRRILPAAPPSFEREGALGGDPTFLHRLSDSPAYKEGKAKTVRFPILQLTPHDYNTAADLIPVS